MKKILFTPRDNEVLDLYMNDARKHKPLTREQEGALSELIRKSGGTDMQAVSDLVSANLLYALHLAKQYMGLGVELNDLVQDASMGLVEAAKKFDGRRGVAFISFAKAYIVKYIILGIQANGHCIRKPKDYFDARSKYYQLSQRTAKDEGRMPTFEEFEVCSGLSHDKAVVAFSYITSSTLEFDAPFGDEDGDASFGDMIASESQTDATVCQETLRHYIDSMCTNLNMRNRGVLYDSFGLNTGYPLSNVEIADKYHVDVEQVRKIRANAIDKIRRTNPDDVLRLAI